MSLRRHPSFSPRQSCMQHLVRSLRQLFNNAKSRIAPSAAMASGPSDDIKRMRAVIQQHGQSGWEVAWKEGRTPWDATDGQVRPPLKELVESKKFPLPTSGRAIVPGCGRGYDAAYFAALGLESWGVDISATAVNAAKEHVSKAGIGSEKLHFKELDFFDFQLPEDGQKFTLAYDYTFLCALPPSMRDAWASRYAEIVPTGGLLIALIFPIDGDREGGPPYSVSPDLYSHLLDKNFERMYLEKPGMPSPGREGKEMMSVWKRR